MTTDQTKRGRGRPPGRTQDDRLEIVISSELKAALVARAAKLGTTASNIARQAIEAYMREPAKKINTE